MRKLLGEDYVVIGLILVLMLGVWTIDANASSGYNQALKECLYKHGFVPGETHVQQYNWNNASSCVNNKQIELAKAHIRAEKEFLKNNPWYTGKNWNWEKSTEYTCERVYSTTLSHSITVCHKPMFIN
jgi:hypothetical protein